MKRLLAVMVVVLGLVGCANYQVGDVSKAIASGAVELYKVREQYCESSDPLVKAQLLTLIRMELPEYPVEGLCTNLLLELSDGNTVSE